MPTNGRGAPRAEYWLGKNKISIFLFQRWATIFTSKTLISRMYFWKVKMSIFFLSIYFTFVCVCTMLCLFYDRTTNFSSISSSTMARQHFPNCSHSSLLNRQKVRKKRIWGEQYGWFWTGISWSTTSETYVVFPSPILRNFRGQREERKSPIDAFSGIWGFFYDKSRRMKCKYLIVR